MRLVLTHQLSIVQVLLQDQSGTHHILRLIRVAGYNSVGAIFRSVGDGILYFIKAILNHFGPDKFDVLFSKRRRGWLIWARYGINLPMKCTDPSKERSFFRVFWASRAKMADVLHSMGGIPDWEIWYRSQSISNFATWHFRKISSKFFVI